MSDGIVLELFAGPGGASEGARMIGIADLVGIELDGQACLTRSAAGHRTVRCDVAGFDVRPLERFRVEGCCGSPPCTTFSAAGDRAGTLVAELLERGAREAFAGKATRAARRRDMARVLRAARWGDAPQPSHGGPRGWDDDAQERLKRRLRARKGNPALLHKALTNAPPGRALTRAQRSERIWPAVRSASLVVEPARFIRACDPEWVALEQVPAVLPLWQVYAEELRKRGYSAWCGLLNSADYGVPQTRIRAILIASRVRQVRRPYPTHYDPRKGAQLFGTPWRSMSEALGWGADGRPSPAVTAGGTATGGAEPFGHRDRQALEAERDAGRWALRVDAQDNATVRDVTAPAPALKFGHSAAEMQWVRTNSGNGNAHDYERDTAEPSPTVLPRVDRWVLHTNRDQREDGSRQTADPQAGPAPALTAKSGGQWVLRSGQSVAGEGRAERAADEPALAIIGRADLCSWVHDRPATTVQGDPRIGRPGHKGRESGGESQFAVDSVRITPEEAAALQSFPPGYPFQGTRTAVFTQIGNAVPPLLAAHVLSMASGQPLPGAIEGAA